VIKYGKNYKVKEIAQGHRNSEGSKIADDGGGVGNPFCAFAKGDTSEKYGRKKEQGIHGQKG